MTTPQVDAAVLECARIRDEAEERASSLEQHLAACKSRIAGLEARREDIEREAVEAIAKWLDDRASKILEFGERHALYEAATVMRGGHWRPR